MSKENVLRLNKYAQELKNRLDSPTPKKHTNHPESYRVFLKKELDTTNRKLADLKLVDTK